MTYQGLALVVQVIFRHPSSTSNRVSQLYLKTSPFSGMLLWIARYSYKQKRTAGVESKYWLISLLICDNQIIHKLIFNCLCTILQLIFYKNQGGIVNSADAPEMLSHVREFNSRAGAIAKPWVVMLLDSSQIFDRINNEFLWALFITFKFPLKVTSLISWL